MSVPLVEVPAAIEARLSELGGKPVNLYRALANSPDMLAAWIEFAWSVRQKPATARRLRELMIVRGAALMDCGYELAHHRLMARRSGVSEEELDALDGWRESPYFTPAERAALALTEAATRLSDRSDPVPDEIWEEAARHFDERQLAALTLEIAGINAWNRLNVTTAQPAGQSW